MTKPAPTIEDILNDPLYTKYDLTNLYPYDLTALLRYAGPFDAYCSGCGRLSTFKAPEPPRLAPAVARPGWTAGTGEMPKQGEHKDNAPHMRFQCQRVANHRIWYFFLVQNNTLIKVGQYPSLADLQLDRLERYEQVLPKRDRKELARAIGLNAHGVGVGAFVYLRRIFERLIAAARQEAATQPEWDETAWKDATRMREKIELLQDFLPELLVKNANMYGILSKGVHELDEEECLLHFGFLRNGIEMILTAQLARREQREREQAFTASVATVSGQLKKGDKSP